MDIWNATGGNATNGGEGWGTGDTFEADWLRRLGFEQVEGALEPSPLFQLVVGSAPGTVNLGTLLPLFLPSSKERQYVNGFPWGTPGVSYCLWQGVYCCMRYQPEQSEDLSPLELWNQLESGQDVERKPFGRSVPQNNEPGSSYEQIFSTPRSKMGAGSKKLSKRKVPSGVFTAEMNDALAGLTEAGFDPQFTKSCSYPFSVYSIDLSSVGLDGSLPESLGDLTRLSNLDLSNNTKLVGPVPASALQRGRLDCLGSLEIWRTGMNCKDDCPVPPFMCTDALHAHRCRGGGGGGVLHREERTRRMRDLRASLLAESARKKGGTWEV